MKTRDNVQTDFEFPNVLAWLDYCDGPSILTNRNSRTSGRSFTETDSWEEAMKLAREGWQEGAQAAREISAQIKAIAHSRAYRRTFTPTRVGGGTLLVGRYVQNLPECYLRLKKIKTNRFVTVVVQGDCSANVGTDVMIRRGATMCAVVEILEQNNIRARVELVFCSTGSIHRSWSWRTCLKDFSESLDIDRLAFHLAHPSSLRRLNFSAMERLDAYGCNDCGSACGGYGAPIEIRPDQNHGDIWVPGMNGSDPTWKTIDGCVAFLKQTLKEQGVEL